MEQYIPCSLVCDLFSRNLETYLHFVRCATSHRAAIQKVSQLRKESVRTSDMGEFPN